MAKEITVERVAEIIGDLKGKRLVVEGRKDKEALKRLGLNNIIAINGRPLFEVAEEISKTAGDVVILTDYDRAGRELCKTLSLLASKLGKNCNSRLRREFMEFGKGRIEDLNRDFRIIEASTVSFREVDVNVKTRTHVNKVRDKGRNKGKGSHREA